jgi:hypothetical protein
VSSVEASAGVCDKLKSSQWPADEEEVSISIRAKINVE